MIMNACRLPMSIFLFPLEADMKRPLCLLLAFLVWGGSASVVAQDSSAAKVGDWSFSATPKGGGLYVIDVKAVLHKGWKLFSTTMPDSLPNSRIALDSGSGAISTISELGDLQHLKDPLFDNASTRFFLNKADFLVTVRVNEREKRPLKGSIHFMALQGNNVEGPDSIPFKFMLDAAGNLVATATGLQTRGTAAASLRIGSINLAHPVNDCGGTGLDQDKPKGLFSIFVLGLLGGFIALITPCVFPMVPLTVSFFTKRAKDRKSGIAQAGLYGFFIFLIYVLLSVPFYFLPSGQESILNNISTNIWLNLAFFVIFVAFALSFFGLFEITLPSSIANKADSKSSVGSIAGIFFMAVTLALVSFSCTGPILGTLLAGALATNGSALQLTMGMGGFGLALALPFAVFALFPGWLNAIPKSGGWLTSVKIVLGFVELALALKFFSNADLVEHWGILKREVFFGLWIIIGINLVLYLLGVVRFAHETPSRPGWFRISLAMLVSAFVVYLIPGLTNTPAANRALISGFPPPLSYSIYGKEAFGKGKGVEPNVVNDYNAALALGRARHKPILVDFTGWACVNCRKTEENIWPNYQVKNLIVDDYILVSLYVDDRKRLPDEDQFLYTTKAGKSKSIVTIGDKFATLQSENFVSVSQPLYVLLTPDQELLTKPIGYTPDPVAYANWLRCGLEAFSKISPR
jgi:thiol:disulfide interchange protein